MTRYFVIGIVFALLGIIIITPPTTNFGLFIGIIDLMWAVFYLNKWRTT